MTPVRGPPPRRGPPPPVRVVASMPEMSPMEWLRLVKFIPPPEQIIFLILFHNSIFTTPVRLQRDWNMDFKVSQNCDINRLTVTE
jgi:hypothetical protein